MSTISIDTHRIVKHLLDHGYTQEQAEGFVDVFEQIDFDRLTTKQDLALLEQGILGQIAAAKADMFKWFMPLFLGIYGMVLGLFFK